MLLIFPFALFSITDTEYVTRFSDAFQTLQFDNALTVLDQWEKEQPWHLGTISGMKAATYLCKGDLVTSQSLMETSLTLLAFSGMSETQISFIKQFYDQAITCGTNDTPFISLGSGQVRLCSCPQPIGTKFKYWFGVGETLVGILVAPLNPPLGATLITTGLAIAIDAGADAWNNKEAWERDLQQRQQIGSDY